MRQRKQEAQILKNNLLDRVKEFIRSKNMSVSEFEKTLNKGNGYISKLSENTGRGTLEAIQEVYPDFDIDYTLTGKRYLDNYVYVFDPDSPIPQFIDYLREKDTKLYEIEEDIRKLTEEKAKLQYQLELAKKGDLAQEEGNAECAAAV